MKGQVITEGQEPARELLARLASYESCVADLNTALTIYAHAKIRNERERTLESRLTMLEAESALDVRRNLERADREALSTYRIIYTQSGRVNQG